MHTTADLSFQRLNRIIFPALILMVAVLLGLISANTPLYSLALIVALLYGLCLFIKPMWTYYLLFVVVVNFFGFIPESFMQVPGAFKLYDVCLLSQFVPLLIAIASDRNAMERIKSPSNKVLIFLMFFILFVILYTVYEFEVSFALSTRIPRKYLLYMSFFLFMHLIKDEKEFRGFLKVFFVLAAIQASLVILQIIAGPSVSVMPFLAIPIEYQYLSGMVLPRIYLPGGSPLMFLAFAISFWLYITGERKGRFVMLVVLLGMGVFCEFYRTKWVRELIVMTVPFILAKNTERKKLVIIMISIVATCVVGIIIMHFIGSGIMVKLGNIVEHFHSAYIDFINKSGTFNSRLQTSSVKLAFFWKRPWLNLGFLHLDAARESSKAAFMAGIRVESTDCEITTLLTTMGIVGTTVFFAFGIYMLVRCVKVFRKVDSMYFRAILLAIFGHHVAGLATFYTYGFLTLQYNIPFIALALAMIEKINQIQDKYDMEKQVVADTQAKARPNTQTIVVT